MAEGLLSGRRKRQPQVHPIESPLMNSTSPRHIKKVEQLGTFLNAPTLPSFLEPSPDRSCEMHRVGAERQADGSYKLFTRSPSEQHKHVQNNHLPEFLETMLGELKGGNGHAVHNMRRLMLQWKSDGYMPRVAELREANAALHAEFNAARPPVSEFQLRTRARYTFDQFAAALREELDALSTNDPRRNDLASAGDQLAQMLFQPHATLSLQGISPDTLDLLITNGLMDRFAGFRDGVDPAPEQLILPGEALHLHDRLPEYLAACPLVLC